MNIANFIDRSARRSPDSAAVRLGSADLFTYAVFAKRIASLSGYLQSIGIAPAERVAIFMSNSAEFLEILQATFRCGAVAVPVNAKLHGLELGAILENAEPALLFVDQKGAEAAAVACAMLDVQPRTIVTGSADYARALAHDAGPLIERAGSDLAWLFFTSGTTGRSKGAMLTHRNLTLMSVSYLLEVNAVGAGDTLLHAAPMSHGSGMYIFPHVMRGASQTVTEEAGFDEAEIASICSRARGVSFFAAPTMVHRLVRYFSSSPGAQVLDAALEGLKQVTYGGGPMLLSGAREARKLLGGRLAQIYGQGECPMTISRLEAAAFEAPDDEATDRLLSSVGQPFSLVEVAIEGAKAPNDTGEILARSDIVMAGYWRDPEATARAIASGWLRTGDVGFFDELGNLHLADRIKDVIISGGTNIYSREVEDVLVRHPSVDEIAVIGRPSKEWGEEVVAFVKPADRSSFDDGELDRFCLSQLARFKRPKSYHLVDELPKNAYGKIEKSALRAMLRNA